MPPQTASLNLSAQIACGYTVIVRKWSSDFEAY